MAKLINSIDDLKRYIVVASTFDFKKVLPFSDRVERNLILDLIGQDQYDSFVIHPSNQNSNSPISQVKKLLEEAIANYSLFLAMPTINILITNSGSKNTETSESKDADWKDKKDLNRTLLKAYNEALDSAFQIMEENISNFSDWKNSRYYTVFKQLIVQQTSEFNTYFNIQKNRQTFVALKPYMLEVEDQYFKAMLGQCTLDFIKKNSLDPIVNNAQEIARKAVVALTVAKAALTGTFTFTDSSFSVSTDQLPWEKQQILSKEDRIDLMNSRQKAGENYLKSLKKVIIENPLIFTCYQDKIETGLTNKIIKKRSGLFF
jgi:hypothetical protein